jgi:hypothetical protein
MKGDRHEDERLSRLFGEMRAEERRDAPEFAGMANRQPAPLVAHPRWGRLAAASLAAVAFAVALTPRAPETGEGPEARQLAAATADPTLEQWLQLEAYEPATEVLLAGLSVSSLTEFQASTDALLPVFSADTAAAQTD